MIKLPNQKSTTEYSYTTLYNKDVVVGRCNLHKKIFPDIHCHPNATEIYVIVSGEGEVFDNDHWEPIKAGDTKVFEPGVKHALKTTTGIELIYIFNVGPFENILYDYNKV